MRRLIAPKPRVLLWVLAVVGHLAAPLARADVVFDDTWGGPVEQAPTRMLDGRLDYYIDQDRGRLVQGGGRTNLFHSFETFTLTPGESASFRAVDPIDTIIARVTGGSASIIEGRLRSEVPDADLFFVNPAGITFTQTATLDLPASFFASTADFIRFDDGGDFSSTAPMPDVTAAAPEAFGFFGDGAGTIDVTGNRVLELGPGQAFGLVGSDVTVGGRSEIVVVGGDVGLAATGTAATLVPVDLATWRPIEDGVAGLGRVTIEGQANVETLDRGAPNADQGRIVIRGGELVVDLALVRAGGDGVSVGSDAIDLETTRSISIVDASVESFGQGSGTVGGVRVRTPDLEVSGAILTGLSIDARGSGDSGALRIETGTLRVENGGEIQTDTSGTGRGGAIEITADAVSLDAGLITTETAGPAVGGAITIVAQRVVAENLGTIQSQTSALGLSGNDAGPVRIEADTLELRSGGRVSGTTLGSGRGADVTLDIEDTVVIDGAFVEPGGILFPSGVFARSGLANGSPATGTGGAIVIEAGDVSLTGGATISASSRGDGDAGSVVIDADRSVTIGGGGGFSGVFAEGVTGEGGRIEIDAKESISIRDGGQVGSLSLATADAGDIVLISEDVLIAGDALVSSRAEGTSNAGSVTIDAGRVRIEDGARVLTDSDVALGGNVTITATGTLEVSNGAVVRTDVQGLSGAGGDVVVDAESVVINASSVTANARSENAQAGNLFFTVRAGYFESTDATVTATNTAGLDGQKVVDGPINQVIGDLVTLDGDFVDASSQLETPCIAGGTASGSFSVRRSRAPPAPPDMLLEPRPMRGTGQEGEGRCEDAP